MNRKTYNAEDRALEEAVRKSTRVSSYLDNVYDAIVTGSKEVQTHVPDYSSPMAKQYRRSADGSMSHEAGGFSMNMEGLFQSSADALGDGVDAAVGNALPPREDNTSTFAKNTKTASNQPSRQPDGVVTENQFRAIRNYPQIVEFLGTSRGTKIANQILSEINTLLAEQIKKNTQLIYEKDEEVKAVDCIAQKQFLHQFFQGEGWGCKVTASGPFRGDEAFFFKHDEDKSFVLRRIGTKYSDVSKEFNIIHDYREVE